MSIGGDVSRPAHCPAIFQRTADEFGRIDILVSNAAHQMTLRTLEEISDEEWEHIFARATGPTGCGVVLLASDEGSYISAARIAVTGGRPIL